MSELNNLFYSKLEVERWNAERENASARLEIARIDRNMWFLLSQHEPVASLEIDRDLLKLIFAFIKNGQISIFDQALRHKEGE